MNNPITNKPIVIYVWKTSKINQDDCKIVLRDMNTSREEYSEYENAKQVARLFSYALPGNTIDVIYDAIRDEIMGMLESPELVEILKSPHDIQNRIRSAMNRLCQEG